MKITAIICLAVSTLLAFHASAAEDCHVARRVILPITFNTFTPTVKAIIDGREVDMGIDTGAQGTVVTPETVGELNLPADRNHSTTSISAGGTDRVNNVFASTFEFAGVSYGVKSLPVLSLNHTRTASEIRDYGPPSPMAGLIGADILSGYDIEYDPAGRTLALYTVSNCSRISPPWHGQFVRVPVIITPSQRFSVPVILNNHKTRGIFDTGSSGQRLALSAAPNVGVTADMLQHDTLQEGTGAGNHAYRAPSHRFDSFIIGREVFHGLSFDVIDFPPSEADVLIGEDYMHARRFWLSYATGMLFIQRKDAH